MKKLILNLTESLQIVTNIKNLHFCVALKNARKIANNYFESRFKKYYKLEQV